MINYETLEIVLKSKWTSFLDVRKLIAYAQEQADIHLVLPNHTVNNLSVTRFELTERGFILWLEYNLANNNYQCKAITETVLDFTGKLSHISTQTTL
jgi:hypothetical protein